jgi:hypothetical protein
MNLSFQDVMKVVGAMLLSLSGGGMVVMAMANWLGKMWANRLMQEDIAKHAKDLEALKFRWEGMNKRVQAELDKTVYVHRVQFETEFKALTDIWNRISDARSALAALGPILENNFSGQDNPLVRQGRFDTKFVRFAEASGELRLAVNNQSPFYPLNIYAEMSRLMDSLIDEEAELKLTDELPFTGPWFERRTQNFTLVRVAADRISEMIRERIKSLSLYPE